MVIKCTLCYAQLSPLYLLSTLNVTHMKIYSRLSTAFFTLQAMESWVGPGNEATSLKATGLITFA